MGGASSPLPWLQARGRARASQQGWLCSWGGAAAGAALPHALACRRMEKHPSDTPSRRFFGVPGREAPAELARASVEPRSSANCSEGWLAWRPAAGVRGGGSEGRVRTNPCVRVAKEGGLERQAWSLGPPVGNCLLASHKKQVCD